jgi:hypothetical protein
VIASSDAPSQLSVQHASAAAHERVLRMAASTMLPFGATWVRNVTDIIVEAKQLNERLRSYRTTCSRNDANDICDVEAWIEVAEEWLLANPPEETAVDVRP